MAQIFGLSFGKDKEPPLLQTLLDGKFINGNQLKKIKTQLEESGDSIEKILLEYISREILLEARTQEYGRKFMAIDLIKTAGQFNPAEVQILPLREAQKYKVVVLQEKDYNLAVAMVNPFDDFAVHIVEEITGRTVMVRYLCLDMDLDKFIHKMYDRAQVKEKVDQIIEESTVKPSIREREREKAKETPRVTIGEDVGDTEGLVGIRQIVDAIIQKAIDKGASDVHIEPTRTSNIIRYRVDGILHTDEEVEGILNRERRDRHLHNAIVNIIKNRSGASGKDMRLDEREKPQDGRIYIPQMDLDLRVSIIPSLNGESVVIRLHNREVGEFSLEKLGFEERDYGKFKNMITYPYGMLLVSGPTGSGKTTTLYSVLQLINSPDRKTLTVEDPIEYSITGAVQAQTNVSKGFTFDQALRAFLRHDPDIIMVGEIRDPPTASMAVEAALTGHLVLSSIHANDAVSTIVRLKDLGVDPRLITSTCIATMAQRLVRKICPFCKEPFQYSTRLYRSMNKFGIEYNPDNLFHGKGCDICKGTGYSGRLGIFELMEMTFEIKESILKDATTDDLEAIARKQGMRTLLEDALTKVARGITTEEEVWRVTLLERI